MLILSLEDTLNELSYGGPEVRVRAVRRLAELAQPQALPLLVEALADPEPEVRTEAARALQVFNDRRTVPALLTLLADTNWIVRAAAAATLGKLGDAAAAKPLLKLLEVTRWQTINILPQHQALVEATIALGRLHDPRAASILSQLLKKGYKAALSDWQLELRMAAAVGLGYMDTTQSVSTLLKSLTDRESARLREAIVTGLAATKSEESYQLMLRGLEVGAFEDKTQVWRRLEGITIALGLRGETRAVPYLLPLAKSPYPEVRLALARTMVRLDAVQADQILIGLLRDRMAEVRAVAAQALGELQIAAAQVPLLAVAQDPDRIVAQAARASIEAIKLLGSGRNRQAAPLLDSGVAKGDND